MTREEAIAAIGNLVDMNIRYHCDTSWIEALRMAIEALSEKHQLSAETPTNTPTNTSTNLISRADAIKKLEANKSDWDNDYNRPIEKDIQALKALPSATPTDIANAYTNGFVEGAVNEALKARPTGEWIFNPKDAIELMFTKPKCSECGFESADGGNFCPNCGAQMLKGGGSE